MVSTEKCWTTSTWTMQLASGIGHRDEGCLLPLVACPGVSDPSLGIVAMLAGELYAQGHWQ